MTFNWPTIPPLDDAAAAAAAARLPALIKPPGSLGRLETLAARLAGMQGTATPRITRKDVVVMAGDHGVARAGVSIAGQSVTAQMLAAMLRGQAAISVLTRLTGAELTIVDIGVAAALSPDVLDQPNLRLRRIANGTANLAEAAALTTEQLHSALAVGLEIASTLAAAGSSIVVLGEMGIGNTTPSSAILAALTGKVAADVTGPGAGVSGAALERKVAIVQQALDLHQCSPDDPTHVLRCLGGFEIAGLVGLAVGAASHRIPVLVDGFITGVAALLAVRMVPAVRDYLIAGHRSAEPGHTLVLDALDLDPLLELDMRLGEGTGAVLALQIVEAAAATYNDMATFPEAGIVL